MKLDPLRRCWVEIDRSALRFNAGELRKIAGPGVGIMAVVKADAYGHGLEQVAEALCDEVDWFCVANVREALRVAGTLAEKCLPILILSPLTPDEYQTAVANGFSCPVSSEAEVMLFGQVGKEQGRTVKLHAVADTGMGRMGASEANWKSLAKAVLDHPHCLLEGVATHFPNADEDATFTRNQIARFRELTRDLIGDGGGPQIHLANSAGLIDFSGEIDFATLSRPGLALYGVSPDCQTGIKLRPALTMKSRITLIREIGAGTTISYGSTFTAERNMKVAAVAVGYGDGYPRHLSAQGADVLIAGRRCPLLGRVTMDQIVVDVSALDGVKPGDEVVLIGEQGGEIVSVNEIATKAGTIAWEIFTGLTSRAERVFRG